MSACEDKIQSIKPGQLATESAPNLQKTYDLGFILGAFWCLLGDLVHSFFQNSRKMRYPSFRSIVSACEDKIQACKSPAHRVADMPLPHTPSLLGFARKKLQCTKVHFPSSAASTGCRACVRSCEIPKTIPSPSPPTASAHAANPPQTLHHGASFSG